MRILMINSVCGIRSTGRICTDLAQTLEQHGHEVRIAYGREKVPQQFEHYAVRIGTPFGVRLHALKARLLDASGFGSYFATKRFLKWVRAYDPDVIHLHNVHGYYLHAGLLFNYLRSSGKRVIWTLHDFWSFTGHSPLCELKQCGRFESGCGSCPLLQTYPASFVDRSKRNWKRKKETFRGIRSLTLVTPSQWLADQVGRSFLRESELRVIHNGIDTDVFRPAKSDFREIHALKDKRVLLAVSTVWDDTKGLSDYIALARRLGEPWRVVLAGMTAEEISRLPDCVIGLPRTSDSCALAGLYTSADLLLNFSYCETFPTVNLEAEACGTPVLCYEAGGAPETILPNCGWVVPKGDLDAAERLIRSLWENETGPDRIRADRSRLNYKKMHEAYMNLYTES